ncbi:MAG: hypothetical protein ABI550_06490 [Ignavibacteriaceae bacterium]
MKTNSKKLVISLLALITAGISPNLFPISQAGYANLSDLAITFLIPSIVFLLVLIVVSYLIGEKEASRQILRGIFAGMIATIGLEIVRETGFHLGGMPGDLPKLMGVLLLNQFALGPDVTSNIAGWSYHFWNGASFGIIYSILFGRGKIWLGTLYGTQLGLGFMISPVVVALGVGRFGVDFGWGFPITVILAHLAFGTILGTLLFKWNKKDKSIFNTFKNIFTKKTISD